jgi:hypothetical protein
MLTDDEHEALMGAVIAKMHNKETQVVPIVEAIVDSHMQELTAERDELIQQVERLQTRILKAEPRPNHPIDDFGGNIRSMYIRVSDGWLRRFDKWRKAKGLSRSGAIRKLVQDAWEADNGR